MAVGIYTIYWEQSSDKAYIGQSVSIETRRGFHIWSMKKGTHANSKLQHMYNKYGPPIFATLEICSINELTPKEIFWINEFDSISNGYNLTHPDVLDKGYLAPNSKYSKLALLLLFRMLRNKELSNTDIAKLTGIGKSTVIQIARGDKHYWLHEKYPNISKQIKAARDHRQFTKYNHNTTIYVVKDTNGIKYTVNNISQFCRDHGQLNIGNFSNMLYGNKNTCSGYSLLETAH
jgi:DNA-binding XRE family transcriptional regulator